MIALRAVVSAGLMAAASFGQDAGAPGTAGATPLTPPARGALPADMPAAKTVATLAALRALPVSAGMEGQVVLLKSHATVNDGGGGLFQYAAGSGVEDDGGTALAPSAGPGRWLRLYSGALNPRWFGARGDGAADDRAALQAAMQAAQRRGGVVFIPAGVYRVVGGLTILSTTGLGLTLEGEASRLRYHNVSRGTVLAFEGPADGLTIRFVPPVSPPPGPPAETAEIYVALRGIAFRGHSTQANIVKVDACSNVSLERCVFTGAINGTGLKLFAAPGYFTGVISIRDCVFNQNARGIHGDRQHLNLINIATTSFTDNTQGIVIGDFSKEGKGSGARGFNVLHCHFEGSTQEDIITSGGMEGFNITDSYFETASTKPRISVLNPVIRPAISPNSSNNKALLIAGNTFSVKLALPEQTIIKVEATEGVDIRSNYTSNGGATDRYFVDIRNSSRIRVQRPQVPRFHPATNPGYATRIGGVPYLTDYEEAGAFRSVTSVYAPSGSRLSLGADGGEDVRIETTGRLHALKGLDILGTVAASGALSSASVTTGAILGATGSFRGPVTAPGVASMGSLSLASAASGARLTLGQGPAGVATFDGGSGQVRIPWSDTASITSYFNARDYMGLLFHARSRRLELAARSDGDGLGTIAFVSGANAERARFAPRSGHLLLGSTADDGAHRLQVTGSTRTTGVYVAGSAHTTLTDPAGRILSAALNTVQPAQGGLGTTGAPAPGQLPIGNGTGFALAAPTAGAGLAISAGPGSLTLRQAGMSALRTGTATLVAGTVTVQDAATTPATRLRLSYVTPAGTPGAVFVSAKAAGASFTLTSTSAGDASTVYYEAFEP